MNKQRMFWMAVVLVCFVSFGISSTSSGATMSWTTTAFTSMAHGLDYTWEVSSASPWLIPSGQEIVGASLYIYKLVSIRKWLFSPISALGSNFNPRNTSMYSCG